MNKNKQKEAGVGPFLNIFLEKSRGGGGVSAQWSACLPSIATIRILIPRKLKK